MNPAFAKAMEVRLHRLEKIIDSHKAVIADLLERLAVLEAKRGPGRPPKAE